MSWKASAVFSALFLVLGIVVVALVALAAVGRLGELPDAEPDRTTLALANGPLSCDDLPRLRFAVAFRGYRMDEVDAVLDRLAADMADRDRLPGVSASSHCDVGDNRGQRDS